MRALLGWLREWARRNGCRHHWHAADAMILWRCCWCGKDVDGMPNDETINCYNDGPRRPIHDDTI